MESIKKILTRMLTRVSIIVTCVCVAVPLFDLFIGDIDNTDIMLIEIVAVSLLGSLGELLILKIDFFDKRFPILIFVYYIYVNICVIGFGCLVGWFDYKNHLQLAIVAVLILVIFIINYIVSYIHDKALSDKINNKLEEFRENEENKH